MVGEDATPQEVEAELGPIRDLRVAAAAEPTPIGHRPEVAAHRIGNALGRLRSRAMSEEEIERLLD
jgi:hypothetical protein